MYYHRIVELKMNHNAFKICRNIQKRLRGNLD